MNLLSPLVLVSVFFVISGQFLPLPPQPTPHLPVSSLCHSVRCPHGQHCRVVQSCPHCQPQPVCVSCVPRGVDAVCHRHHFLDAVLHGDHFNHQFLTARRCTPHIPHDCPFDSVCVADGPGLAHGECCYNRVPPGFPIITPHPQCIPNRCLPFCPLGQTCQRVTICPFVPPCFEEYQCRPIFGPLQLGAAAALTLGNE
nr:hypothetical protein BgiMline_026801 [Biomphalaria glabrata]